MERRSINIDLSVLPDYRNKACTICTRRFPETILNIEGFLHHGTDLICIDRKSCERVKRRLKG